MKRNIKYVKDVLDKLNKDKVITREKLFYSIGIICILFMFTNRLNNMLEYKQVDKQETKPPVVEHVEEKKTNKWKSMSFKEKFKLSREYYGANGVFMWNGKKYHCKYKEEMNQEEVDPCQK